MRIKTRSGSYTTIPANSVVAQEKRTTKSETYYVLYLRDGRKVSAAQPVEGVKCTKSNKFKVGGDREQGDG